jgi:hypothetical protein
VPNTRSHASRNHLPVKTTRFRKGRVARAAIVAPPLRIRATGVALTAEIEKRTRTVLSRRLSRFGTQIQRIDVRLKDVNGPRGGADTVARIQVKVVGRPSVFVEERALDAHRALARAAASLSQAMDSAIGKLGRRAPAGARPSSSSSSASSAAAPASGAAPSRRAPPASTPRRRPRRRGMIYRLEESATKPSRKSTRKSVNRAKGASQLSRRTRRAKQSPKARASRAQSQRKRSRSGR